MKMNEFMKTKEDCFIQSPTVFPRINAPARVSAPARLSAPPKTSKIGKRPGALNRGNTVCTLTSRIALSTTCKLSLI